MRLERRVEAVPPRGIVSGALVATEPPLASSLEAAPAEEVGVGVAEEPVARRAGTDSDDASFDSPGDKLDARLESALQPPKSAPHVHAAPTYTDAVAKRPSVRKQRS